MKSDIVIENVKEYYGKKLQSTKDLKTNVCTSQNQISEELLKLSNNIPQEIVDKYYGCGLIMPDKLKGKRIIDLGCGAGRDCYLIAQIIGEEGSIVGVDMTPQQILIARKHFTDFKTKFKSTSQIDFICGNLENLKDCGLKDKEFDVAISNCVINLTTDKEIVLRNVLKVLKDGGELYFSDVYSDRTISEEAKRNKVLWGECLSGALHWKSLFDLCQTIGFTTPRLVVARDIELNSDIQEEIGDVKFISATFRIFKTNIETIHYSNLKYLGKDSIHFDVLNNFEANKVYTVDPELYSILTQSRFKDLFEDLGPSDNPSDDLKIQINPFLHCLKAESICCQTKCC